MTQILIKCLVCMLHGPFQYHKKKLDVLLGNMLVRLSLETPNAFFHICPYLINYLCRQQLANLRINKNDLSSDYVQSTVSSCALSCLGVVKNACECMCENELQGLQNYSSSRICTSSQAAAQDRVLFLCKQLLTSKALMFIQTSAFSICWMPFPSVGGIEASCMRDASQDGILTCFVAFFLPHDFVLVRLFDSTWIQEDSKAKGQWSSCS